MKRRLAAAASLLLLIAAVALALDAAVKNFPNGLVVLACVVAAVVAAWWGLVRGGPALAAGLSVALALVAGAVVLAVMEGSPLQNSLVIAFFLLSLGAARVAFSPHLDWPEVRPPERAVLFYNPKSGGGKAERFHVADEARARGIQPVELRPGEDLVKLVDEAIAGGADALAMAGGDGSQAIVAAKAAESGLPYACIPSGTRNHFALDLGVDREDVVGALDAFVNGRERTVDLAEVNGRVFVNNVSLGVYAEAVQRSGYRAAKLRTIARTAPEVLGHHNGNGLDLHWIGPDGRENDSGAVLLVSNDPYRLGRALGSGTRPSLERGTLGIAVFGSGNGGAAGQRGVGQWASESFEVTSGTPVAAGIDGEAVRLDPPLRFRTLPAALRVRIAPQHPGASPSALMPASPWGAMAALARIAAGRSPSP
ncbi:MAG TPA: diacylglycerol kinase family protein [Thermoleophilaceae bacterium]|nr:diacylglycerol kinase family protein [Thermoleophilaceae bacterium]